MRSLYAHRIQFQCLIIDEFIFQVVFIFKASYPSYPSSIAVSASRLKHRESDVWQRRFWEHAIKDEADLHQYLDYIHYNPVKHGLVLSAKNWQYSSFHRYVQRGVYDLDWGSSEILFDSLIGME